MTARPYPPPTPEASTLERTVSAFATEPGDNLHGALTSAADRVRRHERAAELERRKAARRRELDELSTEVLVSRAERHALGPRELLIAAIAEHEAGTEFCVELQDDADGDDTGRNERSNDR